MYMLRLALIAFAWVWSVTAFPAAAQDEKVPKELMQYVREAQKVGLKPEQITQKALAAGWPEENVKDALTALAPKTPEPATAPAAPAQPDTAAAKIAAPLTDPVAMGAPPSKPVETAPNPASGTAAPATSPAAAPGGAAPAGVTPGVNPLREKAAVAGDARGDDYLIEATASVPVATVRTDGKISMPLIKEVQVSGLTPSQVEAVIQEQLGKIIRTPDVTVIVAQINSKKVYLTGQVKKEGPLKYTYRMTVLQAISEAGGLTDYAKRKEIYVLHTESGRTYKSAFNYNAVLKGEHMEQNIFLSPGDTIVIP
jgi:polysaccharide export outer membrane protein